VIGSPQLERFFAVGRVAEMQRVALAQTSLRAPQAEMASYWAKSAET
jgi:hypothetical protein